MEKKMCLSNENKMIAGVCGGIAEYFGFEVSLVRIAYVLLALMLRFPLMIGIYFVLWAVLPRRY